MSNGPSIPAIDDQTESAAQAEGFPGTDDDTAELPLSSSEVWERRVRRKRYERLLELLATLDFLIYVELGALYYLDTSTMLFVLRTLIQLVQISYALHVADIPPSLFPASLKSSRANVFVIIFVNLVAVLLHFLSVPPSAGEVMRGYLHGHLIVDLIGQKALDGWAGRLRLVVFDIIIITLQVLACGLVWDVDSAKKAWTTTRRNTVDNVDEAQQEQEQAAEPEQAIGQDQDQEPVPPDAARSYDRIEDDPLEFPENRMGLSGAPHLQYDTDSEPEAGLDREHLLQSPEAVVAAPLTGSALQAFDSFYSGQIILLDFRVADMIRNQFWEQRNRRLEGRV